MKQYDAAHLRNVGLFGHGGSGKTSLAEAVLFQTRAINRLGKVEEGSTTTDFDPDEVKRTMSISLALAPLEWRDHKLNLVDAPGYADFFGEVAEAMRAVDGAVVVVDGVAGVEVGTELVWREADRYGLPRVVFVNKLERENASFSRTLDHLRSKFGTHVVALGVPIGAEHSFTGVVDLVARQAFLAGQDGPAPVPGEVTSEVDQRREALVEAVCEHDDALLEKYLEEGELSEAELRDGLRTAVTSGKLVPVLCGSAHGLVGIGRLLDTIVETLPSAAQATVRLASGETARPSPEGPLAGLVFKTISDPHIGKLSYVRVYSGTLSADSYIWNSSRGQEERVGHLFLMRGKSQEPMQAIGLGDIGVIPKLGATSTGDSLSTKDQAVVLAGIPFPDPSFFAAIHPRTRSDVDKLGTALSRVLEEDPSLRVSREESTSETILSGLGESHVGLAMERMERKFGVRVSVDVPKVAYRETITATGRAQGRHVKQSGGHGQYGVVTMEVEPLPDGADFEFVDKVVGGVVPRQYIPGVEKGVRDALGQGVLAGYPVVGVRVSLVDGKYHPVDSSEQAFRIAGALGFKAAAAEARPILLEPIMEVEITVPDEFTGDVMGDLNSRRARVLGMNPSDGTTTISAYVPQAEMLRYATILRSLTQGRGIYAMRFASYEEVPAHLAQKLIEERKKEQEEARA
ncbi:MAG: elongation factor G [Chloroflexi bacterium]|nr:elongation factor G [Chloroflexota bacterium]